MANIHSNTNTLRLNDYGRRVGAKLFELVVFRERNAKRETRVLGILQFIHTTIWKTLFGRPADSLEKSRDNEDECNSSKKLQFAPPLLLLSLFPSRYDW